MENQHLLPLLLAAIEEAEFEASPYSGRGMYGAQCVSFTAPSPLNIAEVISKIEEHEERDMIAQLGMNSDSMGYDVVIYFPSLEWDGSQHG